MEKHTDKNWFVIIMCKMLSRQQLNACLESSVFKIADASQQIDEGFLVSLVLKGMKPLVNSKRRKAAQGSKNSTRVLHFSSPLTKWFSDLCPHRTNPGIFFLVFVILNPNWATVFKIQIAAKGTESCEYVSPHAKCKTKWVKLFFFLYSATISTLCE